MVTPEESPYFTIQPFFVWPTFTVIADHLFSTPMAVPTKGYNHPKTFQVA